MIGFSLSGSTRRTRSFLQKMQSPSLFSGFHAIAQAGVAALQSATPAESGLTASSWGYEIRNERGKVTISWLNTNRNDGANIAILLQYGHGTGTGGYVSGRDYINPTLAPIFDQLANDLWKQVTSA